MPLGFPPSLLGFWVSGDFAGETYYTDRFHRIVSFPIAPPCDPPSPMQVKQRGRFATAVANWHVADAADREGFEEISLRASLCMTGLNLWIHTSLKGNFEQLGTLQRQTGISVNDPPFVAWPE